MAYKRIALVTLLAVFGYVNPAHAITANLSVGSVTNPNTGTKDGGSFTTTPYTNTTTFNSATPTTSAKGGVTTYTYTPTFSDPSAPTLTYTWTSAGTTSIRSDQYAPPPPNGSVINQTPASTTNNTSKYLATFQNAPVTITSSKLLNYFGVDLGYVDAGNQLQFYNTNVSTTTPIKTFSATDLFGSPLPNPEGSSYVNFVSDNNSNDFFNQIVITEVNSGAGYETDNYAVKVAPAPSEFSGLVALGLMGGWSLFNHNRKLKQKQLVIK